MICCILRILAKDMRKGLQFINLIHHEKVLVSWTMCVFLIYSMVKTASVQFSFWTNRFVRWSSISGANGAEDYS
jgi:hypothetical protein